MKFRYFILKGDSLKAYLESEKKEFEQMEAQRKALLEDRDDIESYRPGQGGGIMAIKFKEGKQPAGFVSASKNLSDDEVRPHARSKEAKPWRDLLSSIRIQESCQGFLTKSISLPDWIIGGPSPNGFGSTMYSSRAGHVGDKVYVEVPQGEKPYEPHEDLEEVKGWEFEKACEESKDFDYKFCYVMRSRTTTA